MLSECRRSPPRTGMHGTQMSVITDAALAASPPPKFHASLTPSLTGLARSTARSPGSILSESAPPLGESLFNLLEVFLVQAGEKLKDRFASEARRLKPPLSLPRRGVKYHIGPAGPTSGGDKTV